MAQEQDINLHLKFACHNEILRRLTRSLCGQSELSDIGLVCSSGRVFEAHKLVLAAVSPFFRTVFRNLDPSKQQVMLVPKADPRILEILLTYIYVGEATLAKKDVDEFVALALELGVKGFEKEEQAQTQEQREAEQPLLQETKAENLNPLKGDSFVKLERLKVKEERVISRTGAEEQANAVQNVVAQVEEEESGEDAEEEEDAGDELDVQFVEEREEAMDVTESTSSRKCDENGNYSKEEMQMEFSKPGAKDALVQSVEALVGNPWPLEQLQNNQIGDTDVHNLLETIYQGFFSFTRSWPEWITQRRGCIRKYLGKDRKSGPGKRKLTAREEWFFFVVRRQPVDRGSPTNKVAWAHKVLELWEGPCSGEFARYFKAQIACQRPQRNLDVL